MAWTEETRGRDGEPSGIWRAVWRDERGKQRSKSGFRQKAEAGRFAGEQESRSRRGEGSYRGRSTTWAVWCDYWLARRVVEPSTAAENEGRIRTWLLPRWADVRLSRIERSDVQSWVNEMATKTSAASVEKNYRLLATSLRAAVLADVLAASPCVGIKLPKIPPGKERYLTHREVDAVLEYMRQPYQMAALLLVSTGLRFGEMAGLHWQRVDLERGVIDVVETWDPTVGRIKPYPKGSKRRGVPLLDSVAAELIQFVPDVPPTHCGHPHAPGSACRSGLVLQTPQGKPMDARNMRNRHWKPALERAGVDHARQHDLRHTTASWLINQGVPLEVIQKILGHASLRTTERYSHLGSSAIERAREALAR